MSASGKSNVTDENLDKYSVELIWRRYTGHMETGKAWKDELKVVLFRQKYGVWWVCKLNTDMQNTVVRKLFFEYPPTLNLDDIVKDIFLKIPLGNETYIVNVTAGGSIKMIVQSYGIWEFTSAIVFSYDFPGIIFYRKVSGIIFKNVAYWTETMV